jgi:hypothetical protein
VLAPESQIRDGVFAETLKADSLWGAVEQRIAQYEGREDATELKTWFLQWFEPTMAKLAGSIRPLSWEEVIETISTKDAAAGRELDEFYNLCKRFNPKPWNVG